jgi:uncharacterized protein YydD (DUF2326 family)
LYSNQPEVFQNVRFDVGVNVVLAEIRLPENREKDTHNLGKTTLGRLIDFCLLSRRNTGFFLFKHEELFKDYVFFLEVQLLDGSYVTVRRSVAEASKVSLKRHQSASRDFSMLPLAEWDHAEVPFEKAKTLFDGVLALRALKPWNYRQGLGYLLRTQDDYRDVFQLGKQVSKHVHWKPFLAHWLGFDAKLVERLYAKEELLEKRKTEIATLNVELGGSVEDVSKVEGLLLLKQTDASKKQRLLDAFDFGDADKERTKRLVDDVDGRIAGLNAERYTLRASRKKIVAALDEGNLEFSPADAQNLFAEVGVQFPGQLKKDFEQLIAFNRAISDERRGYLEEERAEIDARLADIDAELVSLGQQRREALAFLGETDIFNKYRALADELVGLRADLTDLERRRTYLKRLQTLRGEVRDMEAERGKLQSAVERDVELRNSDSKSLFSEIRLYFSEIIENVIARKALLSVFPNQLGHLEFKAEILDESGSATSADDGHTYKKLLCAAFDMAVLRAHLGDAAPRFLYHDGIFESLDDRKKLNLVGVMRRYAELGIQLVVTLIDSDLPAISDDDEPVFHDDEIVLRLHDEGPEGRLFRMKTW